MMRPDPLAIPRKGRGYSDGLGTYRKYLLNNYAAPVNESGSPAMDVPAVAGPTQQSGGPPGLDAYQQGHDGNDDGQ